MFFFFSQVGLPLAVSASAYPVLPLLHQVWLMPSGFRLSIYALCVCHSRILSYIPSAAPPPHIVLFYPLRCFLYLVSLKITLFPLPFVQNFRWYAEFMNWAQLAPCRPSIRRFPIYHFFICNVCWPAYIIIIINDYNYNTDELELTLCDCRRSGRDYRQTSCWM